MAHCYFTRLLVVCLITTTSDASARSKDTEKKQVVEGFPVGFQCRAAVGKRPKTKPGDNDIVQCVIQKNDQELFNESFLWKDIQDKGYFVNHTEGLDKVTFNITLAWGNETSTASYETQVVKSFEIDESDEQITRGDNTVPYFSIPDELRQISQEQLDDIGLVCYKDNMTIDEQNLEYQQKNKNSGSLIKILNASCEESAGYYECYFQYNGTKLKVRSFRLCVTAPRSRDDPIISIEKEDYDVEPGKDLTMTCSGNMGHIGSNNARIYWKKILPERTLRMCWVTPGDMTKTCTMNVSVAKCCKSESAKYFPAAIKNNGNFNSTFTIKNVTSNDSGNYSCKLRGGGTKTFTITITSQVAKYLAMHLGVALVFAAVVLVVLILGIFICRRKRTEIKYFKKKRFGKFQETGNPITYLLYSDDALGRCRGRNPLGDVIRWLKAQHQHYYDPNDENSYSSAGGGDRREISHLRAILDRCLSMTVFVTYNLLNENTWEVFRQYMGFEENVKRNFPIVFICEKELEEFVKKEAKNERKSRSQEINGTMRNFVTLEHFMKRNTVIHWKPKSSEKFDRALYAALPKVRKVNDEEKEQYVTI